MSVRDYITGKLRFPPGPPSSCGEDDVLMVENIDLQFGDDEELKFGDLPDAVMAWDGTDLTLDVAAGSVVLTSTHGAITGEEHSLDIISTATLSSGDALVGLNVAITPSGEAGAWASAIFGKVTEVAAAPGPVSGYFCGAEFEVNITGTQPSAYAVLVLNSNADNETYGQYESYIWLHEYGSKAVRTLFWFADHSRATESNTAIVSVTGSKPFDTAIRCSIGAGGTTGLWLLASSVGPADANIDFKMLGSADTNYIEYDASEDTLNIVVASRTITGEDHALSIAYAAVLGASDSVVGVNSVITLSGGGVAGTWVSAFYGKVDYGAADSLSGYASAAEFEIAGSGSYNMADFACLVLNTNISNTGSEPGRAFIWLNDYGTMKMDNLIAFRNHSRATASDVVLVSQMPQTPFDTAIRCRVGSTPVWLYGSTVGPASIANFKWIGSTSGNYFEWSSSGNVLNLVKAGIAFSGAMPATGLDFGSATFTAGADYNVLSYGDDGAAVTLSITGDVMVIRMSIISAADPGSDKGFAFFSLLFSQTTEAQDHLYIQGMRMHLDLSQDLKFVFGVDAYVDVESSLTVEGFIGAGKFTIDLTGGTLTYHDGAVVLAQVTGSGANSCSGPAAAELCCLMLKVAANSTIGSMLTFFQINGCAVTNGIYVGSGAITNFMNFERGNAVTAVLVGAACKTSGLEGTGVASDGAIRILVAGTPYYIPFYSATNTDNSW